MKVKDVENSIKEVLYKGEDIISRIKYLAKQVDQDYDGKELVVIGVLKGAFPTFSELVMSLNTDAEIDFVALSTYGEETKSSGKILIEKDITLNVIDKDVLIVDDIYDSGLTISWLTGALKKRGARTVESFVLLKKKVEHKYKAEPKYVAFEVEDKFVVGFGLDYAQKYRNLDSIAVLSPRAYDKD
jgi:hypoxanthine phosphoribosyltransferase